MATDHSVFINDLVALTGLNKAVVTEWANLENGANNNILGVTSGGVLKTYPNQAAAAQDTAHLLKTLPAYSGVIASTTSSPAAQALAIAKSPWIGHVGYAYSPYYLKGFQNAGILTNLPINNKSGGSSSGSSTTTAPPTTTSSDSVSSKIASAISAPFFAALVVAVAIAFVGLGGIVMLKGNS